MILKRRSRLVYFRLSEDEYTNFENMCKAQGARSLSDMMRNALQKLNEPEPISDAMAAQRLFALNAMLEEIQGKVHQVSRMLDRQLRALEDRAPSPEQTRTPPPGDIVQEQDFS